jgi:hypothetical protein
VIVNKVAADGGRTSILIVKDDEGYVLASHEDPSLRELRIDLSKYPEIKEVIIKSPSRPRRSRPTRSCRRRRTSRNCRG